MQLLRGDNQEHFFAIGLVGNSVNLNIESLVSNRHQLETHGIYLVQGDSLQLAINLGGPDVVASPTQYMFRIVPTYMMNGRRQLLIRVHPGFEFMAIYNISGGPTPKVTLTKVG